MVLADVSKGEFMKTDVIYTALKLSVTVGNVTYMAVSREKG
jgi:hypothetical protein